MEGMGREINSDQTVLDIENVWESENDQIVKLIIWSNWSTF